MKTNFGHSFAIGILILGIAAHAFGASSRPSNLASARTDPQPIVTNAPPPVVTNNVPPAPFLTAWSTSGTNSIGVSISILTNAPITTGVILYWTTNAVPVAPTNATQLTVAPWSVYARYPLATGSTNLDVVVGWNVTATVCAVATNNLP